MQLDLGKNICESLLKDGLISHNTVQNRDKMELAIDDLLACFPAYMDGNERSRNCLKKKIGRILSIKARSLNVSEDNLIKVKAIVYNKINKLVVNHPKRQKRTLKIGKKREIYSSEDQYQALKVQQNQIEETGSAHVEQKSNKVIRKRKYKTFDHEFKQQVCQTALESGIQYACKHYNLSSRKVTGWLESHNLNQLGKGRKALDPAMEFNMSVWILKKIWEQIPLTQKIIRQKAATMNTLKIPFNGSKGWLQKFFLRHVELKSCFDTRGKLQTRQQCARYHKSAFDRLLKDYECLKKMQIGCKSLVRGDLQQIIYQNGSDPVLKLKLDKNIDKFRVEQNVFYDYEKFKLIQGFSNKNLAKIEEQISEQVFQKQQEEQDQQEEDEQEEFQSSEDEQEEIKLEEQKICKDEQSQYDQRHLDIYEEDEDSEQEKVKVQQKAL